MNSELLEVMFRERYAVFCIFSELHFISLSFGALAFFNVFYCLSVFSRQLLKTRWVILATKTPQSQAKKQTLVTKTQALMVHYFQGSNLFLLLFFGGGLFTWVFLVGH